MPLSDWCCGICEEAPLGRAYTQTWMETGCGPHGVTALGQQELKDCLRARSGGTASSVDWIMEAARGSLNVHNCLIKFGRRD
uniref:Putative chemokine-related protein B42 n=1 Tax=Homo sapiens TaxID=9606 RepID=CCB42_HUMAN|nr:RecName: Full=Putative chemokine-related protein B42 [Homo sapiens]BAE93189.1 hypothetical protein [Homo sapiens]BAE93190.1 hypothetical protein [Homo sapiens]BAE93191.1 hypothetical protein [Homo sapiens]BAE93192.1 hypothetical protein [Homo sapiens]